MGFCDPAGNGQPESYASPGAASILVDTVEAVEEIRKMFRGHANASIMNPHIHLIPVHPPANGHLPSGRRILDGIVKKIKDKLQQQVLVDLYSRMGTRVKMKPNALVVSRRADVIHYPGNDLANINVLKRQGDIPSVRTSQSEEGSGQTDQAVHLFIHHLEYLPIGFGPALFLKGDVDLTFDNR